MPEVRLDSPNQCLADGSTADAEARMSAPSAPEPVAAFGGTDGTEGGSNAGSEALVRRFADDGGGGAPGSPGALSARSQFCAKEDLGALAACAGVLRAKGRVETAIALAACAAALLGVGQCASETNQRVP